MDRPEQYMELIDRYLGNELTAAELEQFERMRKEDASFRELLADMELLTDGIRSSAKESMLEEIRGFEKNQPDLYSGSGRDTGRRFRITGWISIAAAACITAVLYLGVIRPPQSERMANAIYREYYDGAFKNVIAMTFRSDSVRKNDFRDAFDAYDTGDFRQAAALFSKIPVPNDTVLFFLGNAWMELKEYENASGCFRKVLEQEKFMVDQSRWFLALSLLKSGLNEEAELPLKKLSGYPNFYQAKATEIANRISSLY